MSHLHMTMVGANAWCHPAQGATPSATLYNASTTSGDSDFPADGSEDAIVYSVSITQDGSAGSSNFWARIGLTGSLYFAKGLVTGDAPLFLDFGPDGLRIPGGFSVFPSSSSHIIVVYDRVSSNA